MTIILKPGRATLSDLEMIYRNEQNFRLESEAFVALRLSAENLAQRLVSNETIYGVNTGFGKLASVKIDSQNLRRHSSFQANVQIPYVAAEPDQH